MCISEERIIEAAVGRGFSLNQSLPDPWPDPDGQYLPLPSDARRHKGACWGRGERPSYFDVAYVFLCAEKIERCWRRGFVNNPDEDAEYEDIVDMMMDHGGRPGPCLVDAARSGRLKRYLMAEMASMVEDFVANRLPGRVTRAARKYYDEEVPEDIAYEAETVCSFIVAFSEGRLE